MIRSKFYLFIKFGYPWLPKLKTIFSGYIRTIIRICTVYYYERFVCYKDRQAQFQLLFKLTLTIIKIKAWPSLSILLCSQISWLKNFLVTRKFFLFFLQIINISPKCCKHESMLFHSKMNCQAQFQSLFKLTSTRGWVSLCVFCQAQFKPLFTK